MLLTSLLVATLAAAPGPSAADPSVALRLLPASTVGAFIDGPAAQGLAEATAAATAPLTALGEAGFPLDQGGGVSGDARQIIAVLLAIFVGFGTGHLIARDTNGFLLFLIIDVAIVVVSSVFLFTNVFRLGYLALLVSHVIQALDVWGKTGGEKIIQRTRENTVRWAAAPGVEQRGVDTHRTLALSF